MTTATAVGYVEMRIAKVVGLAADDESFDYVVLEEVAGDRQFAISIGDAEAAPEVLQEAETRRAGDSPEAARLRRALAACPMTIGTVGM